MAQEKIYAIVYPDGISETLKFTWDIVRNKVEGVSAIKYKSFASEVDANAWIQSTKTANLKDQKRKAIFKIGKEVHSKMDWKAQHTNTPYWNKIRASQTKIRDE